MIYLDYNARAPLLETARRAMVDALELMGNPSSVHAAGRSIRKAMEEARSVIAAFTGAKEQEIIFTSGASEGNTQILTHFKAQGAQVLISAIEHDSVQINASGATVIPVTVDGVIDLGAFEQLLQDMPDGLKAVSIMAANNETGVIQPIAEAVEIAKRYKAWVHVDATQAAGRVRVSFKEWDVDYLTFSSHKLGGPLGAGAVVVREGRALEPLIQGGGQEQNRRAGTQNVPAIVGFAAAVKEMQHFNWHPIATLRDAMEQQLKEKVPVMQVFGQKMSRLANTSCIQMPGVESNIQVMAFDLAGIAVSAGSACSSGKVKPSNVLKAMGISEDHSRQTIRVSLCPQTTARDLEQFIATWLKVYKA